MGEVGSTFIELKVAHDTVVGEIFCYTGFSDAEMISETRLDGLGAAATGGTAQKTANGDTQGLARFNIVVGGKVGVAEKEHAGTYRSAIGLAEL